MASVLFKGNPVNLEGTEVNVGDKAPAIHDIDGGQHDSLNQTKKMQQMNQKIAESKDGSVPVYYLEGIELIQKK